MKPVVAISLLFPLALCSCDKVVEVVKKAAAPEKKEASPAPSPSSTPLPLLGRLKNEMVASRAPSSPVLVHDLSGDDYDAFIATPGILTVVDYHAEWCGPCKQLAPVLENVAGEFGGKVSIGKVDVDRNAPLARKEKVSSIPDVRLFVDGRQVARFVGVEDEAKIRSLFKTHADGLKTVTAKGEGGQAEASPAKAPSATIERMSKDWIPPGMQRR